MSKAFDTVGWMRKRRTQIDREDEGLSWEDKSRKTLKALENDPLWKKLSKRLVRPQDLRTTESTARKA